MCGQDRNCIGLHYCQMAKWVLYITLAGTQLGTNTGQKSCKICNSNKQKSQQQKKSVSFQQMNSLKVRD